jgi:adenylate cyclase class IV
MFVAEALAHWMVLELAGFRVVARYDKKREEFKLGSAHLVIDYLSGFGWFVEIEAEPEKIISIEKL